MAGQPKPGASRAASRCHGLGATGLSEEQAQRRPESRGVAVGDDHAGPAREEFHRVGKGGGHDRSAGGDGIDEHAGGDLVSRVVREHDNRGVLDQAPSAMTESRYAGSNVTDEATPLDRARAISMSR